MQLCDKSENNICQLDGNQSLDSSIISDNESDSSSNTIYATDDEVDPQPIPANFFFPQAQIPGQPNPPEVQISSNKQQSSRLPLCMMLNARSLYNKVNNFKSLLYQIGSDIVLVSETWERQRQSLDQLLSSSQYKTISYCRKKKTNNRQPGGGCAICVQQ